MTDSQLEEAKRLAIVVRDTMWVRLPASEPPKLARISLELIAELERIRPVYEAAKLWRSLECNPGETLWQEHCRKVDALQAAIDSASSKEAK